MLLKWQLAIFEPAGTEQLNCNARLGWSVTTFPTRPYFSFAMVGFVQPAEGVKIAPLKIVRLTITARLFYINERTSHLHDESVLPLRSYLIGSHQRQTCQLWRWKESGDGGRWRGKMVRPRRTNYAVPMLLHAETSSRRTATTVLAGIVTLSSEVTSAKVFRWRVS